MVISGAVPLAGLVMLATLGLLILALADLLKRPSEVWEVAGHNQLVWALVVIFVGFIGPVLYLVVARPALNAGAARRQPVRNHS